MVGREGRLGAGRVVAMAFLLALTGLLVVFLPPVIAGELEPSFLLFVAFLQLFTFVFALPSALASAALLSRWRAATRTSPALAALACWACMAAAWVTAIGWAWPDDPGFAGGLAADLGGSVLYGFAAGFAARRPLEGIRGGLLAFGAIALPSLVLAFSSEWRAVGHVAGLAFVVLVGTAVFLAMERPPRARSGSGRAAAALGDVARHGASRR